MPKDRGAEQGDADGPLECSLALGMMVTAARTRPWIGAGDSLHERRLQDEQRDRVQRIENFQLGGPEKLIGADDPRHAPQVNGGPMVPR